MKMRAGGAARGADKQTLRTASPFPFPDAIARAAKLSLVEYDQQRKELASALGIRATVLDQAVNEIRPKPAANGLQGQALEFPEVEPHTEPVDGTAMLSEIAELFKRHIVLSEYAATALALWCVWTYLVDAFAIAPLLGLTSATKRCGKTRTLGLAKRIVARPLAASNISPAAVYRAIEKWHPTLLVDEADSFVKDNEQLRGVLNSGHTRDSAFVIRSEGDDHEPRLFSTWGAKLWAAIGSLASTLMDRSIVIVLKRRARGEGFAERLPSEGYFEALRSRIVRWANDHREELQAAESPLRDTLDDRAVDNWWPLIAIATAIDSDWGERARAAAANLSGTDTEDFQEITVALLRDIWRAFELARVEEMHTETLLTRLEAMLESAWATWHHGRPMTAKALANLLRRFGIHSVQIKIDGINRNGYKRSQFADEWDRYRVSSTESTSEQNQAFSATTHSLPDAASRRCENGRSGGQIRAVGRVEDGATSIPSFALTKSGKLCSRCGGLGRVAVVAGDLLCTFCVDGMADDKPRGSAKISPRALS